MSVEILPFETGPFATNTYVVREGGECWVIDPGIAPRALVSFLTRETIRPGRVVLTHGHCDHIAGIPDLRGSVGPVDVWCPADDAAMLSDATLNLSAPFGLAMTLDPPEEVFRPGETLTLGETAWAVLDTSGHTPGGVSLYCAAEGVVFAGDALFSGSIGRTDRPGADGARLVRNIREALLTLPAETAVYAGHGPATTIGAERQHNPFL